MCMVSPLAAVVHGQQLLCFRASLRPSLVIRTKNMLTNSANFEPRIAMVTVYEYFHVACTTRGQSEGGFLLKMYSVKCTADEEEETEFEEDCKRDSSGTIR